MAYDVAQAERLRRALARKRAVVEKKMFGGICFMLRDHMLCGTGWEGFMFRVGEEREAQALKRPGATLMEIGERKMRGFIWVEPARCGDSDLANWIKLAEDYIASLPPKKPPRRTTITKAVTARTASKRARSRVSSRSAQRSRNPPAG